MTAEDDQDQDGPDLRELCWTEKPSSWPAPRYCRRREHDTGRHDYGAAVRKAATR